MRTENEHTPLFWILDVVKGSVLPESYIPKLARDVLSRNTKLTELSEIPTTNLNGSLQDIIIFQSSKYLHNFSNVCYLLSEW